jgi:hypothetical protein
MLDNPLLRQIAVALVILTVLAGFSIGLREIRKGLGTAELTGREIAEYLDIALFVLCVLVVFHLARCVFRSTIERWMPVYAKIFDSETAVREQLHTAFQEARIKIPAVQRLAARA